MTTVGGLPAHILLVHAVIGLVPLTAVLVVLVAVWPSARRWLTWPAAAAALVTLVSVPVTTDAGEWLERRVERTELMRAHTELGDTMLPWAIALAVIALAFLARKLLADRAARRGAPAGAGGRVVSLVLAVLAVVAAVGAVAMVYRVGDSGARAVWTGQFTEQAQPPPSGRPPAG
jgi:hypothetical protein